MAGTYDVCNICKNKLMKDEKLSSVRASNKLAGKLNGQKVMAIKNMGDEIIVCGECVRTVYEEIIGKRIFDENESMYEDATMLKNIESVDEHIDIEPPVDIVDMDDKINKKQAHKRSK